MGHVMTQYVSMSPPLLGEEILCYAPLGVQRWVHSLLRACHDPDTGLQLIAKKPLFGDFSDAAPEITGFGMCAELGIWAIMAPYPGLS